MTVAIAVAIPKPIIKTRHLTVQELESLNLPIQIQENTVLIERSLRGWKLKEPVTVPLDKILAVKEKGLVDFILKSFLSERPKLISFVLDNQTLIKMARHFLRHLSSSTRSCLVYTVNTHK